MRIVFIGAVQFSEKALSKLILMKADINVVGACTVEQSNCNTDYFDLIPLCKEHNIPVKYTSDINSDETINWIRALAPDAVFCFGWSRLLKTELLNLAPFGVVGYHPTALPSNRGRHPLIWALVLGLHETASTFFFMEEGADSGDIISQRPVAISENDDAGTLYQRITETAIEQIEEFIPGLASGNYKRIPQDHSKASYWRKRNKRDGQIDWRMSARSIHNLVRGLTKPYVGAHFEIKDNLIKVWETTVVENSKKNIEPGKVLEVNEKGTLVKAGKDAVRLIITEPVFEMQPGDYL
ncbi:formyltransferase family protein [bacterium]|nr:formyltransferase family protein [bacterium]